uniref:Short chain dehydrogenase n=1 Tax=Panagrolaimus sp. JU765 TaxID=591449 RepID=A0AC34Q7Z0_9BILA
MKRYDLMHQINLRGSFLMAKKCIPYLKKSENPHILTMSPPLNMDPKWFGSHVAYTISKYGMSMLSLGLSEELKPLGIASNTLWPRTVIWTSAIKMLAGAAVGEKHSRKPQIVADAAYAILGRDAKKVTGKFFIDDEVLASEGIKNLDSYAYD